MLFSLPFIEIIEVFQARGKGFDAGKENAFKIILPYLLKMDPMGIGVVLQRGGSIYVVVHWSAEVVLKRSL